MNNQQLSVQLICFNLFIKKLHYENIITILIKNREIADCPEPKRSELRKLLQQIDFVTLDISDEIESVAHKIIDMGILTNKSYDDCQHIAAAVVTECNCIISWNFKHIVNVKTIRGIKAITTYEGYKDLMIYPPSALLEEEDEDYDSDDKRT